MSVCDRDPMIATALPFLPETRKQTVSAHTHKRMDLKTAILLLRLQTHAVCVTWSRNSLDCLSSLSHLMQRVTKCEHCTQLHFCLFARNGRLMGEREGNLMLLTSCSFHSTASLSSYPTAVLCARCQMSGRCRGTVRELWCTREREIAGKWCVHVART